MKLFDSNLKPGKVKRYATIALGMLAMILYGSLYPFDFHRVAVSPSLLGAFLATWPDPVDRGDVISNILLYFPLGFFAVRCIPARSAILRIVSVTAAACLLATLIELAQFYDEGRGPSVDDALGNTLGTLLGAMAGVLIRGELSAPMLLLTAWFGTRLLPYLPSLDVHKYALAAGTLFTTPVESIPLLKYFALWLAAAALLEALLGVKRSRPALLVGVWFVMVARIVITDTALDPSEVAGAALATITWIAVLSRLRRRVAMVCAIFVTFVTVDALRPFHFSTPPREFGWVPFNSFMEGPRESGSRTFLEKTFIYGALVWLINRAGISPVIGAASAFVLVLGLRLVQIYLPGRSAEITDAVMVLILAGIIGFLGDYE